MKFSPKSCLRNSIISLVLLGFLAPQNVAKAFEYEFEIPIQDEEDVNDAYTLGLIEDEDTVNTLINLLRNGLDINDARYNDLMQLPGVTVGMANAILQKRKELGKFGGMRDLQAIEEISDEMWEHLIPFLKLPEDGRLREEIPVTADVKFGYIQYFGSGRDNPTNEKPSKPSFYLKGETSVQVKKYKISVGSLLTIRDLLKNTTYDPTTGSHYLLNTKGQGTALSFDGVYGMVEAPWFTVIAGSYNIGFGEKLTFDSTSKSNPNGIATPLHYYENNSNGSLRPEKSLLGAAVVFDNMRLPKGWMTASAWLSYKKEDIYQYDVWYGETDEDGNLYSCKTNSDCTHINANMSCGNDGYCHSSKIYGQTTDEYGNSSLESITYATLYRYYTERLMGLQAAYNYNDRTRIGIVGYASQWLFDEGTPGAMFSLSSSFPGRGSTYAFGLYGTLGLGPVDMGFEASIQDNKGVGAIFRLEASPIKELDLTYRMRFYNALYDNPYGKGSAAADELLGKRNRNEYGNRITLNFKPGKYFRMVTDFDIWSHPYTEVLLDSGTVYKFANEPWITDLNLIQRFIVKPAPRNTITLWAAYKNKDISTNGFSYINDKGEKKGNAYASKAKQGGIYVEGRGEQVQAAAQFQTNAYKPLNASVAVINNWEGVTKYTNKFDYTLKLWVMLSYKPWKFTNISTKFKYWFHQTEQDYNAIDYYDRGEPQLDWYLVFTQQLPRGFSLKAHYGISKYIDNRMDDDNIHYQRYDTYHTIKAYIEWNYESMLATKTFSDMKEQGIKKKKGRGRK